MNIEYVHTEKEVELLENRTFKITGNSEEIYKAQDFDDMLTEKKAKLNERERQIGTLKRNIEFADSIEVTDELENFMDLLKKAQALERIDDMKKNLKVLEMDYANIEREVLAFDNFLKQKGRTKAVDLVRDEE